MIDKNREDGWKGSAHFKENTNYQSFNLKQLKGAFLDKSNFNRDGNSY